MIPAGVFHCAFAEHYVWWMTGKQGRHRRTERVLPILVNKGFLKTIKVGKKNLYTTPDRMRLAQSGRELAINPYHGLACTDILQSCIMADPTGTVLSENSCRANRWGCVPEWAIRYDNATALLLEFCTQDNVDQAKVPYKVARYKDALVEIDDSLQAKVTVLFVLDISKDKLPQLDDPFKVIDYRTFKERYPYG